MTKSQYIHAPSIEKFQEVLAEANQIAKAVNLKRIPDLMVCTREFNSPVLASRRETMSRSQNANSRSLFDEIVHYTRLWTALRFDAATNTTDDFTFKALRKGGQQGGVLVLSASAEVVKTTIHNIRECVEDSNTVFTRALSEGLTFFTKVLPALGKILDRTLHENVILNPYDHAGFMLDCTKLYSTFNRVDDEIKWFKVPVFLGELFRTFYGSHLQQQKRDWKLSDGWDEAGNGNIVDHQDVFKIMCYAESRGEYELRLKSLKKEIFSCCNSLKYLRQLCFLFYKLEVPFDKSAIRDLSDAFCTTDASLPLAFMAAGDRIGSFGRDEKYTQYQRFLERHLEKQERAGPGKPDENSSYDLSPILLLDEPTSRIAHIARYVVRFVLGSANPREIVGKHGPGAVATGERGLKKANFSRIYRKLEVIYPFTEYFMYNMTHVLDRYESMQTRLSYHDEATAKVVFVAKDSRGPRLISCEPLEIQWVQQGIMRALNTCIAANELTAGRINFNDQTLNQHAAWRGSILGTEATIDLKDASDRVSVALVDYLFPKEWVECLLAARSDNTRLPDGRVVELRKFAPMGSATCFPVEALCFFALSVASIYYNKYPKDPRISRRELRKISHSILVYGDDLVIPADSCRGVTAALEAFHLRVNADKSYSTGLFRESCGVDAFYGVNVTPVRVKRTWDGQSLPSQATLPSYVALSNSLYAKGCLWAAWECERRVQMALSRMGEMLIPYTMRDNPSGLSFIRGHKGLYFTPVKERIRNTKEGPKVLRYVVEPAVKRGSKLDWEEMLRCESSRSPTKYSWDFNPNCWRAGRYAVPHSERIAMRWMPYSQE